MNCQEVCIFHQIGDVCFSCLLQGFQSTLGPPQWTDVAPPFLDFLISEVWSDCPPACMLLHFSPRYLPDKPATRLVLIKCLTCSTLQSISNYSLHSRCTYQRKGNHGMQRLVESIAWQISRRACVPGLHLPATGRGLVVTFPFAKASGHHPCINKSITIWLVQHEIQYSKYKIIFILFDLSDIPLYDTSCLTGSWGNWNLLWKVSAAVPQPSWRLLGAKGGRCPFSLLRLGVVFVFTIFFLCSWQPRTYELIDFPSLVKGFIMHYCAKPFEQARNTTHFIVSWLWRIQNKLQNVLEQGISSGRVGGIDTEGGSKRCLNNGRLSTHTRPPARSQSCIWWSDQSNKG